MPVDSGIDTDVEFMTMALAEARAALAAGEVPIGAVVVIGGKPAARGMNSPLALCDPSAHAEIIALRRAAALVGNYRLAGATLYVTLEPCLMCTGAMIQARIARLVFGARDPKAGAICSLYQVADDNRLNHTFSVRGQVLENECALLLREFFRQKRKNSVK